MLQEGNWFLVNLLCHMDDDGKLRRRGGSDGNFSDPISFPIRKSCQAQQVGHTFQTKQFSLRVYTSGAAHKILGGVIS